MTAAPARPGAAPFRYAERSPADALTPWIASYWEFEVRDGAPPVHHVPPDGCTSLMLSVGAGNRGFMLVTGPWLAPLAVPVASGARWYGVRLRPGAARTVLGVEPERLRDATHPADALLAGTAGASLLALRAPLLGAADIDEAARRLDAHLLRDCARFAPPDPLVAHAVGALVRSRGRAPIAELARELGTSERTLLRRFRAATAVTPKQFARVRRLLAAAWELIDTGETWGRIAAAAGFADQPHLHHEFVDLTGLRPDDFGDRVRATEHDGLTR